MFLFDTHLHIDLYKDYQKIIEEIENNSIYTISMTNAPSVFRKACQIVRGCKYIKTALGFHPELVKQRYYEIESFSEFIHETTYIGEVGLDFSNANDEERTMQKKAFERILLLCRKNPKKVLSIHSRKAVADVLSLLGNNFPGIVILHWFSGNMNLLKQAIQQGCYFSINIAMLSTMSSRQIVGEIPIDKLLLESDGPFVTINNNLVRPLDIKIVVERIAKIKNLDLEATSRIIEENFRKLCLGRWETISEIIN